MNRDIRSKSYKIIITIVFVVLSAAYWVLFYLWEFRNLAIPYSIGEFMGLGEFVIPIIALVAILLQSKTIRRKEDTKRSTVILVVLIIVLLCSIGDTYYTAQGFNIGGLSPVSNIEDESGKYYIVFNHEHKGKKYSTKLRCDKEIYDNVIVDENVAYSYEYTWNSLTPQTGYLIDFDLDDYCDNRNN